MLSTMKIPIIMVLVVSPLVLCGSRKLDCTDTFKNRVASFEYSYYPGQWLRPFHQPWPNNGPELATNWASTSEVKTNKKFQWILHDCGRYVCSEDRTVCVTVSVDVCMESKKPGWEDNFARGSNLRMHVDTDLSDGSDSQIHWKIFCDSCTPGGPYKTTFSNCQLRPSYTNKKVYTERQGWLQACTSCGYDSWFRWRIESPPTRVYWKVVLSHCNRGSTNDMVRYTVKTSITTSTSTTTTVSVNAKISAGLGAVKLLQSSGGELGASFTWSRTYLEQLARERTIETSTQVEPGMKWVVSQAVGEAGWTSIATERFKTEKVPC